MRNLAKTALFPRERGGFFVSLEIESKEKPPPQRQRFTCRLVDRLAGRTGPDEGQCGADTALCIAGRSVALFGCIPRNVHAVIAIENVEHFGDLERK